MQGIEGRQPSEIAAEDDERKRPALPRGPALWGGVGFLAGAVFCGAAGLLTETAQGRAEGGSEERLRADAAREVRDIETGSLPTIYVVSAANCTALELDRKTNVTVARACPSDGLALRMEGTGARADVAVLAAD